MRSLSFLVIMLLATSACAQTKVGGLCEYEKFPGVCTVTQVDPDGTVSFTYDGAIGGQAVSLAGNTTAGEYREGDVADCDLQFITTGACTPCLVSIGSCGEEAWAAFTAWAAGRVSGGCSLLAGK
ncbi:MAG: hypothetical protein JXA24_06295 [Proteobacteria bacterium]|nr:hypothetical protein [Pseudomonadota bacterium]